MAKKRAAKAAPKSTPSRPARTRAKPEASPRATAEAAAKSKAAAAAAASAARHVIPVPAPARRAPAAVPLLGRAERLRDAIQQSKLSAADPWTYTPKARAWGQQAQAIVDEVARRGESASLAGKLDGLTAEVERDRDYQEAHRRA